MQPWAPPTPHPRGFIDHRMPWFFKTFLNKAINRPHSPPRILRCSHLQSGEHVRSSPGSRKDPVCVVPTHQRHSRQRDIQFGGEFLLQRHSPGLRFRLLCRCRCAFGNLSCCLISTRFQTKMTCIRFSHYPAELADVAQVGAPPL